MRHSLGPQTIPLAPTVTQHSTTLGHPTLKKGEVLLFKNSDEELEYLQLEKARFEKQCKIKHLHARVLG
jgi:hypothetical protein